MLGEGIRSGIHQLNVITLNSFYMDDLICCNTLQAPVAKLLAPDLGRLLPWLLAINWQRPKRKLHNDQLHRITIKRGVMDYRNMLIKGLARMVDAFRTVYLEKDQMRAGSLRVQSMRYRHIRHLRILRAMSLMKVVDNINPSKCFNFSSK
jgi:hypothetical protein